MSDQVERTRFSSILLLHGQPLLPNRRHTLNVHAMHHHDHTCPPLPAAPQVVPVATDENGDIEPLPPPDGEEDQVGSDDGGDNGTAEGEDNAGGSAGSNSSLPPPTNPLSSDLPTPMCSSLYLAPKLTAALSRTMGGARTGTSRTKTRVTAAATRTATAVATMTRAVASHRKTERLKTPRP